MPLAVFVRVSYQLKVVCSRNSVVKFVIIGGGVREFD